LYPEALLDPEPEEGVSGTAFLRHESMDEALAGERSL
jgi:hypothetical protein